MDWAAWATIVVPSVLAGVAILWIVGGYYHVRYYVLRKHEPETWKCQPTRHLTKAQLKQAMTLSSANLALGGVISGSLIYAITKGWKTPLFGDPTTLGWGPVWGWVYVVASTPVLFVLVDGLAYYAHRALHAKAIFRFVHRWHHRYVATTPFVVTAMHPAEFLLFQGVTFLPLFFIPFHYGSVVAVLVYVLVFNIVDHSGVKLSSRIPWQGPSTYHDDHHAHFHVNFGQHLMFWDRIHGTLRRKDRKYGAEIFGGKGRGAGESAFVDYR